MFNRLFLIPAKFCSSRFPSKNYNPLKGKPLLLRTIDTIRSYCNDPIYISTENPKLAINILGVDNLKNYNINFVYRPKWLCLDPATIDDVILHFLYKQQNVYDKHDVLVLVQPDCPFLDDAILRTAFIVYDRVDDIPVVTESGGNNRCGMLYISSIKKFFLNNCKRDYNGAKGLKLPWYKAIEIHTQTDLKIVERIL